MAREQRRLVAIVSADVVGYSRLMGRDESGTLAAFKAHRRELVDPKIEAHGGRVVKTTGDGLLLEFASVIDAVRCAIAVQDGMAVRNAQVPEDLRIVFRVGVHLGDVIVEEDDLFGDGVNVAARLEGLAKPGGIVISDDAYRQVRDRLKVAWRDAGEHEVKNIARPLKVWSWTPDAPARGQATAPAMPDKPSIAVLPFDNMSGDPEQEYFSDGIAEDIITNLSRIRWLFVIARNSSFVFKGKAVDVRQVSRELGVRYILEGSVRKAGNKVRISAQLIDAVSSAHLWAERYDRELTDIFAVQDEITQNVAAAIEPEILAAEGLRARARSERDLDAWDLVMRAVSTFWRMTKEDGMAAISMLETATEKFPEYGPAHSMLAFALLFSGHMGWRDLEPVRGRAERLAMRAVGIDDQDAWAHITLGYMHAINRRADEAVAEFTTAAGLNPNFAAAYGYRGFTNAHAGRSEAAIADIELALRLSPKDPQKAFFVAAAGSAHYAAGRYDEAAACAAESVRIRPEFLAGLRVQCAALAQAGHMAEARDLAGRIRELHPDVSLSLLRQTLPHSSPDFSAKFVDGLRKAGLPE